LLADVAQLSTDRHLGALFGENLQQSSCYRRFQFITDFVGFEFNHGVADLHWIAFVLEPAEDGGLRGGNPARLRNLQRGNDGNASLATGAKAPFLK